MSDRSTATQKNSGACPASLPLHEEWMPEAEVSLRLAFYLLSRPHRSGIASIAISSAQIRCGDGAIFPIAEFLNEMNWRQIEQARGNDWHGTYQSGDRKIRIHSNPGCGDVVTSVGHRSILAACKGGPLIQGPGSPEYSITSGALGQLLNLQQTTDSDIYVVALPDTAGFQALVDDWQRKPLIENTHIRFALVGRNNTVRGLDRVWKGIVIHRTTCSEELS